MPSTVILLTVVTIFGVPKAGTFISSMRDPASTSTPSSTLFSDQYPVADDYQKELKNLFDSKEVTPADEKLIREWSVASAIDMKMPPAVLWCLFFQESRLHHLEGSQSNSPAKGLGQFLRPTFYEVNNQMDRFTPENSQILIRRMGKDVRPVKAVRPRKVDLSSYYHIPTAVLSSAAYLNNRFHQLQRNLKSRGVTADPNLLWLYSVMAYNKGTRSVLSFWNEAYRTGGNEKVTAVTNDFSVFLTEIRKKQNLSRALGRVWSRAHADRYGAELRTHIGNISRCAMRPPSPPESISKGGL